MKEYNGEELSEGDKDFHYAAETLIESFKTKEEILDFLEALNREYDCAFNHMMADVILKVCIEKNLCKDWPLEDRKKLISLYDDIGKWYE